MTENQEVEVNEEISAEETKEVGAGRRKIKIVLKPIKIVKPVIVRRPRPVGLVIK